MQAVLQHGGPPHGLLLDLSMDAIEQAPRGFLPQPGQRHFHRRDPENLGFRTVIPTGDRDETADAMHVGKNTAGDGVVEGHDGIRPGIGIRIALPHRSASIIPDQVIFNHIGDDTGMTLNRIEKGQFTLPGIIDRRRSGEMNESSVSGPDKMFDDLMHGPLIVDGHTVNAPPAFRLQRYSAGAQDQGNMSGFQVPAQQIERRIHEYESVHLTVQRQFVEQPGVIIASVGNGDEEMILRCGGLQVDPPDHLGKKSAADVAGEYTDLSGFPAGEGAGEHIRPVSVFLHDGPDPVGGGSGNPRIVADHAADRAFGRAGQLRDLLEGHRRFSAAGPAVTIGCVCHRWPESYTKKAGMANHAGFVIRI